MCLHWSTAPKYLRGSQFGFFSMWRTIFSLSFLSRVL
jgi:hypothetical protein